MKKSKRILSLLLGLVMFLTLTPMVSAMDTDALQTRKLDRNGFEAFELLGEMKQLDVDRLGDMKLQGKNLMVDGEIRKPGAKSEEEQYIEDVAESLGKPVGAVDIVDTAGVSTYIVWLQQLPTALVEFYGQSRAASLTKGYAQLGAQARRSIKTNFKSKIVWEYSAVFAGFAIEMKASEARQLAEMPGVYAVTPDSLMYADSVRVNSVTQADSGRLVSKGAVLDKTPVIKPASSDPETGVNFDPNYEIEGMKESREILGIGEIHASGITGAGVTVGVLDTGIDFNHPDLKDNFKGGWNYITTGADYGRPAELKDSPMETTYEQWLLSGRDEENSSGSTFYTDHGTHVSGTVAAQGKNNPDSSYKALGMAPEVDLYVARVLGPYGSGATTGIIAAVEDFTSGNAARGIPKADVINLSLGANTNTAYGSDIFALNNAVLAGVNVAVSAGNNATPSGSSSMADRRIATLGSPGTAYLPVTVAAAQYGGSSVKTYDNVTAGEATFGLLIEGQQVSNTFKDNLITGTPAPVYVEGKGYEAYLAFGPNDTNPTLADLEAIPAGSLAGKILFVKRGLNFTDFQAQALRTGAGALVIVNNAANGEQYITNMVIGGTAENSLPIFSAFHSTSAKLTAEAGGEQTIFLELGDLTLANQAKLPAYFSSIGPVNPTIGMKPDIIAPGWSIVSSAPAFITSADHSDDDYTAAYQSMSGTSMSSPHMCGVLALMKQKFPEASPAELKARLMNTAKPTEIKALDSGIAASVLEVGAGFVDPARAILDDAGVYVTVQDDIPGQSAGQVLEDQTLSSLSFGEAEQGGESRKLSVTVHGTASYTVSAAYNDVTRYSKNATENGVELKYSAAVDGSFEVWVEVPEDAEEGYYEGWLKVTAGSQVYSLPWLVQVGEADTTVPFDVLGTAERPIISTSRNNTIRSAGGAHPRNSNATTFWFTWDGKWPLDSDGDRSVLLYLIDAKAPALSYVYLDYIVLPFEEADGGLFAVSDWISDRAYDLSTRRETPIKNGTYYLGVAAGTTVYYYNEIGLVYTDGVGEFAVQLETDETVFVNPASSVRTATVSGKIFSPALEAAGDAGFYWTEVDDFWGYDEMYEIDQSFNVIGYDTTSDIYYDGGALNLLMFGGTPWVCDEDGYFEVPVSVSQANKNGGWVFTSGSMHGIVGVEGFYYNDNNTTYPMIGANKSTGVAPKFVAPSIASAYANGDDRSLVLTITDLPDGVALTEEMFAVTPDLSPDGTAPSVSDFAFDPIAKTVTYGFSAVAAKDWDQTLTFNVTFNGTTAVSNEVLIPGLVEGPIEIEYFNAGLVSVGVNKKVTLEILTNPVIDLSEYTVTWKTSNAAIATVSSKGAVTGKKVGMVLVTATITNPHGEVASLTFNIRVY